MRHLATFIAFMLVFSVSQGLWGAPKIDEVDPAPIIDPAAAPKPETAPVILAAVAEELEVPRVELEPPVELEPTVEFDTSIELDADGPVELESPVELETPPAGPQALPVDPTPTSTEPGASSVEPTIFRQAHSTDPTCPRASPSICRKCGKPRCLPLGICDQFKENIRVRTHRCQCKGSERPYGTIVREFCEMQILNGRIRSMTLFKYDFYAGTLGEPANLKARGRRELTRIAQIHGDTGRPIYIETTNPELDEQRRQTVVSELESLGFPVDLSSVLVAPPAWSDFVGEESELLDQNLLQQTRSSAQRVGGRQLGGGGGRGGGGFGGGGGGR